MNNNRPGSNGWVIKTKLSPPNLPHGQILRKKLLDETVADLNSQLTIIHAPAGYGKTTFLKQWYEYRVSNNKITSWLSLDDEEKNLSHFINYLVASLKKANVSCIALETLQGHSIDELPARSVAATIINTLEQFGRELFLFLDDYQLVSGTAVNDLVQKLVVHLPENISLIISSRVYPDLAVQHLRNFGKVREISIPDLRFNHHEMGAVIANELADMELKRLWDRTEGWPIACRMIDVLTRNKRFDIRHIDIFSGRTTDLARYITEQVFTSLAPGEQTMLMYTAIPNRFTGDLANELCAGLDCWHMLDTLVKQGLFLIPLDTEGRWYRYHQLFREYLYERLRRDDGDQMHRLHLVAANWFCQNGHVPEAVEHAMKGHDLRFAAEIVERSGGWRLIYQDRIDWMITVLERLDKDVIDEFPRLFMADLLLQVKRGKQRNARQRIYELHWKTNGFERWSGKPLEDTIRIELELGKRLILDYFNGRPACDANLSFARDCLLSVAEDDYILRGLLHDVLSSAYIDAGLLEHANRHINHATLVYRQAGFHYGAVYIYFHRASLNVEQGKLHDARKELLKANEITCEYLDTNVNITANTSVYLADVAFMQNHIDEARHLMEMTMDYIEKHDGWFDLYARAYTTAAGVAFITYGMDSASHVLERARAVAVERNLPRLKLLCDLMEVKLLLLAGRIKHAGKLAESIAIHHVAGQRPCPENLSVFIPDRARIVWARLQLAQNRPDEVLSLLHPLAVTLQAQGRYRLLVEAWLLMMQAAYARRDDSGTEYFFSQAVHISIHEEYKRPFVDEGNTLVNIYHYLHSNGLLTSPCRIYRAFMEDIERIIQAETCAINKFVNLFGLTPKEYRVITEIARGHTNKEIATKLHISENTVKYRLKQLFRKWQVTSRQAALRMARDKSLV